LTISHIGKETNLLEQHEEGILLTDPQAVYLGERDWETVRSLLDRVSISDLADESGVPARTLRSYRRGDRRLSAKKLGAIEEALVRMLDNS
jgi:hypothetical protein